MQLIDVCSMPPVPGSVHEEVQFARESSFATHHLQFLAQASCSASHLVQCSRFPRVVRHAPSSGSSSPREVARTDRKSSSHATPVEFNVIIHGTRHAAPFPAASFEARTVSAAPGTCCGMTLAEDGMVVPFFPQQQKLPCVCAIVAVHGYSDFVWAQTVEFSWVVTTLGEIFIAFQWCLRKKGKPSICRNAVCHAVIYYVLCGSLCFVKILKKCS